MKTKSAIALVLTLFASSVAAHDVWVTAPDNIASNDILQADLSYSHNYPFSESIAPNRIKIFKPMEIIAPNNQRSSMVLSGTENYQYQATKKLKAGTYRLAATYQPTFWVEKSDGKWAMGNLTDFPDAKYCEQTQMFGKRILTVNGQFDEKVATTPIGQALEIVPLANPNRVGVGELLPIEVLYQGKPLAGAIVTATADTVIRKDIAAMHDHREINAYSAKTDKQGRANFLPLVEGQWKVKVIHKADFADKNVCQYSALYATLIVPVGTQRVNADAAHEHQHHHHH